MVTIVRMQLPLLSVLKHWEVPPSNLSALSYPQMRQRFSALFWAWSHCTSGLSNMPYSKDNFTVPSARLPPVACGTFWVAQPESTSKIPTTV